MCHHGGVGSEILAVPEDASVRRSMTKHVPPSSSGSFGGSAISGSIWSTILSIVTKVAALGASLFLGMFLTPEHFGVAGFALSASMYVMVFHTWCYGDLLCAAPRHFRGMSSAIQALALCTSVVQSALIVLLGALLSWAYPEKTGLFLLLLIVALRPLADSLCVIPSSFMKIGLRYRTSTLIEGTAAISGSGMSVLMARFGLGASSLVFPPIAGIFIRAAGYWHKAGRLVIGRSSRRNWLPIFRKFMVLSAGSYVAGVLTFVETSVLGFFAPDHSVGLFVFAFGLASQLNGVIGYQVAGTIQPILGHMRGNPSRQAAGMMRANRLLGAVLVPALLIQAVSTACLFEIAWPGKWGDAVLLHQVISIGQVMYVYSGTSHHMLKGQGRYRTYTSLNIVNLAAAILVLPLAAAFGQGIAVGLAGRLGLECPAEAGVPLAIALAGALLRLVFGPLMVWIAGGSGHVTWGEIAGSFIRPIAISAPIAALTWWALSELVSPGLGRGVQAALLLAICTAGFGAGTFLCAASHSATRSDGREILRRLLRKLPRGSRAG